MLINRDGRCSTGAAWNHCRRHRSADLDVDSVELSVGWSHLHQTWPVGVDAEGLVPRARVCRA
jgi:hypothetical protein